AKNKRAAIAGVTAGQVEEVARRRLSNHERIGGSPAPVLGVDESQAARAGQAAADIEVDVGVAEELPEANDGGRGDGDGAAAEGVLERATIGPDDQLLRQRVWIAAGRARSVAGTREI